MGVANFYDLTGIPDYYATTLYKKRSDLTMQEDRAIDLCEQLGLYRRSQGEASR